MDRLVVSAATDLGSALAALFPASSGRTRKQMLATGRVRVNGVEARDGRDALAPGDVLEVGERKAPTPALPTGLRLVHEDADILVVDKGHGLLTIATDRERDRTAYAFLSEHVKRASPRAKVFIVHRLDREASGLLVFAKTPEAKRALQEAFAAHVVERAYAALVEGRPAAAEGVIEAPLVEDARGRVRIARPPDEGRPCRTRWRLVEAGERRSLLEVRLDTGRKHQIRIHLQSIGHPIVGDVAYGSRSGDLGRLGLHAKLLGFAHPRTGQQMRFESPPPRSFLRLGKGLPAAPAKPRRDMP